MARRDTLDKLLARLNLAPVRRTDIALYEVVAELIKQVKELSTQTATSSSTTIIQQIQSIGPPGISGDDGEDGSIGPPGIAGIQGPIGPTGAAGPITLGPMGLDGEDGDDGLPIPGPQGIQGTTGNTGATGPAAPSILGLDGDDGDDGVLFLLNPNDGGWELLYTRVCSASANEDFTNLAAYSDILVICSAVTKGTSGTLELRVSTDNGGSFLSALGDYLQLAITGVVTNDTSVELHATNATAGRYSACHIRVFNKSTPKASLSNSNVPNFLIPTTTPLNAIRVFGSGGGNLTGGTIYVFGRR